VNTYIIIGIIALIAGYLNLKFQYQNGKIIRLVLGFVSVVLGILSIFGVGYCFIFLGLKDGFYSLFAFWIGGAIGASFGK